MYQLQLNKPHLDIGGRFMSNEVYNGQQVDTFAQWGFHPMLSLFTGKGWSINYTGNIWSKNKPAYALTSIGIQKDFSLGEKFEGSLAYNRWFLNDNVRKQRKEFTQNIELDAGYELGNFSVGLYSMFLWGKSFSSFYSPSLNYTKGWWLGPAKNSKYIVTVTALLDAGNYDASLVPFTTVPRGYLKKKKNNVPSRLLTESSKTFGLLNYELQLQQELDVKNDSFIAEINYSVPSEHLKNNNSSILIYAALEYHHRIFLKKKKSRQ